MEETQKIIEQIVAALKEATPSVHVRGLEDASGAKQVRVAEKLTRATVGALSCSAVAVDIIGEMFVGCDKDEQGRLVLGRKEWMLAIGVLASLSQRIAELPFMNGVNGTTDSFRPGTAKGDATSIVSYKFPGTSKILTSARGDIFELAAMIAELTADNPQLNNAYGATMVINAIKASDSDLTAEELAAVSVLWVEYPDRIGPVVAHAMNQYGPGSEELARTVREDVLEEMAEELKALQKETWPDESAEEMSAAVFRRMEEMGIRCPGSSATN